MKIDQLIIYIIIVFFLSINIYLYFKKESNNLEKKLNFIDLFLLFSAICSVFNFIFFRFASYFWSLNLKVPRENFTPLIKYWSIDHDGIEGHMLYIMMFLIIITAYLSSKYFEKIKITNKTKYLIFYTFFIIISFRFYFKTEFIAPATFFHQAGMKAFNVKVFLLILSLITFLLFLQKKKVASWVFIVLLLIPICFIATSKIVLFDYAYVLFPAIKINEGEKLSSIYFQYDFLMSGIAAIWMKLKLGINEFQMVGQFSFFLFFIGAYYFATQFFQNKKLIVYFIISLVFFRYYSIGSEPIMFIQTTPLRLDLWLILILVIHKKGIHHWSNGLAMGLLIISHKVFGFIYFFSFLQLIFTLFLIQFFSINKENKLNLQTIKELIIETFNKFKFIFLIIIGSLLISWYIFGNLTPESSDLNKIGICMMQINAKSFYWYIPILFSFVFIYLLNLQKLLSQNYFITGIFILYLTFGNSLYFFGRSHEHNILNISGLLILTLYLSFDLLKISKNGTIEKPYKKFIYSSLPVIFILAGCYYYGNRIEEKINIQLNNIQKNRLIYQNKNTKKETINFSLIRKNTGSSKKVYFVNLADDFQHYYFGGYSPKGHFLPNSTWIYKKEYILFLQDLIDKEYYIVSSNNAIEIEYLLPSLKYSKKVSDKKYTFISK